MQLATRGTRSRSPPPAGPISPPRPSPSAQARRRADTWHIPENKADRPHALPLSPLAVELLDELRNITSAGEFWLPSARTGEPMVERARSISAAARTMREVLGMADWRAHDLRRTARTNLSRLGVREEVAERVLNHAPTDRMVATYNQHAYQAEMREALDLWAAHLARVVK